MRDALSGIGLLEKRQDPIDYHERAPLVMPPKLDGKALPQPRARSTSAAWPKDPEIAERERAAAERRRPSGNQARGRYDDNNATLSVDEIRGGRRAGASLTTEAERKPGDNNRDSSLLNPLRPAQGQERERRARRRRADPRHPHRSARPAIASPRRSWRGRRRTTRSTMPAASARNPIPGPTSGSGRSSNDSRCVAVATATRRGNM